MDGGVAPFAFRSGGGVIGLTNAIRLQERLGARVTIVASHLIDDPPSIDVTSHWAAHCVPVSSDTLQQQLEIETFKIFWRLAQDDTSESLMIVKQTTYHDSKAARGLGRDLLKRMPDYRELEPPELPDGAVEGFEFSTVTIDVPKYLRWLAARFKAAGGQFEKRKISHIRQCLPADVVVIAAGIGARNLGGVEDAQMHPIRGQTVLVNAPWVKHAIGRSLFDDKDCTYIIPRRSGVVVLGGTTQAHRSHPLPETATAAAIKTRCLALCPEILPRTKRSRGRIEDLDVIGEGCGLRPAREGGLRCERDDSGALGPTILVHSFGHGGFGYQSSWGTADYVVRLVREGLDTKVA